MSVTLLLTMTWTSPGRPDLRPKTAQVGARTSRQWSCWMSGGTAPLTPRSRLVVKPTHQDSQGHLQ